MGMFGWFQKKSTNNNKATVDFGLLGADMHSHLLPGIDDGAPDVATAIQYIRTLQQLGYQKFITTPHIYPDLYPNTADTIAAAHQRLLEGLQQEGMEVHLRAAAEYFIDDMFPMRLERGEPLLTLHRNWVLVEISFVSPPADLKHIIFDMVTGGYQPVLAHPERYAYYHHKPDVYHRFKDQGCLLQVNALSLIGYYGRSVQDAAHFLVQEKLVDLIGTDLHHERHLSALQDRRLQTELQRAAEMCTLLNKEL